MAVHNTIVRTTFTNGREVQTTTGITDRRLSYIKREIWQMICGPKLDKNTSM